jgi:hypothetical protein
MKNASNMTPDGLSLGNADRNLFSNLFCGKILPEASYAFTKFLNSMDVLPYHISTPAQTYYASMGFGGWTEVRIPGQADHGSGLMAIAIPGSCRS